MPTLDLRSIREKLGLTQAEFAAMLGFSARAVQSCEQGWRRPSPALERSALLLYIARQQGERFGERTCWEATNCPPEAQAACVAFATRQGHLCWFLTGNMSCVATSQNTWEEKQAVCEQCAFFRRLLEEPEPPPEE